MTSTLENLEKALKLWQSVHGNESLYNQCQRISGYYESWAYQGNENIITYPSAKHAMQASKIEGIKINEAPVSSYLYWEYEPYGHVGRVVGHINGRALVSMAAKQGELYKQLSHDVRIVYADTYPLKFIGWSYTNGKNKPLTNLTPYPAVLKPEQRQVLPTSPVRVRKEPNTDSAITTEYKPNTVITPTGWVTGQTVNNNAIWYRTDKGYSWAGGFTDSTTANLKDLNPVISTETERIKVQIPFEVIEKDSAELPINTWLVEQEGVAGVKEFLYELTLSNGEEIGRKLLSATVLTEPVAKIILNGTRPVPKPTPTPTPEPEKPHNLIECIKNLIRTWRNK